MFPLASSFKECFSMDMVLLFCHLETRLAKDITLLQFLKLVIKRLKLLRIGFTSASSGS